MAYVAGVSLWVECRTSVLGAGHSQTAEPPLPEQAHSCITRAHTGGHPGARAREGRLSTPDAGSVHALRVRVDARVERLE